MSAIEPAESQVPQQLVEQLSRGYDSLTVEFQRLSQQHQELENKLAWAKQQYLDALKRFTPTTSSKDFHEFLTELDEAGAVQNENETSWLDQLAKSSDAEKRARAYNVQRAKDAREKLDYRRNVASAEGSVKIWKDSQTDGSPGLEQDFTTSGTPGRLGCPFAAGKTNSRRGATTPRSSISKTSLGRRSKRPSFHDPIRAEICGNNHPVSTAASVEGSMPLCPIRFLDQHSPEEVAQYFEKHKHQLPRSHEMCISRFQENEDALRSLDSKYANMVSMVNGLGKVHQPMLPEPEEIAVEIDEDTMQTSTAHVERWAQNVSVRGEDDGNEPTAAGEDRENHFDRSLKEIRVGESPSRPWGITVPEDRGDATSRKSDPTASPLEPELQGERSGDGPLPPLRCPFSGITAETTEVPPPGHPDFTPRPVEERRHTPPPQDIPKAKSPAQVSTQQSSNPLPQMVFNGPVFFGYPPDQAMNMLKQSGLM
ncbi:hypothetical protein BT63DRAFT_419378 [Microthyrium microscopicum]|uniref:Uncharacterized protein n=1 Tax=Microthyrium microscopicum TaxID=703497 RepID=A0A6A6USX7_9PEZI|nr:hypothetical protein BT63DRAFT_419378 [Microthyrium microscopicum]